MNKNILHSSAFELKWLLKSWMFIVGIVMLIVIPILIESPLTDGHVWIESSASYVYSHALCIMAALFIPISVPATFYYERTTDMGMVVNTQPINKKQYFIGKFLGYTLFIVFIVSLGMICQIFIPLVLGEVPYLPNEFIKASVIYVLPTLLFEIGLTYLFFMLLNSNILTILVVMIYTVAQDMILPEKLKYIIRNENVEVLASGKNYSESFLTYLITNRIFVLCGFLLIFLLTLFINNIKKETESKGRI